MYCTRKVAEDIYWIGGSDRRLALFENLFPIPRGVAYNSYLIMDEKTVVMDTVDASITRQFIENIAHVLQGRPLDYLVVNHMEPDHCANIEELLVRYPEMKIVGNAKTHNMIRQFYDADLEGKTITVKEGDTLALGKRTLHFFFAPMVHWPEVMVSWEETDKILFSADAFGSFGALNGNIFNDELNFDRDWLADARRYYTNIVGKYGPQVQNALKKLSALEIQMICPLHGPIWRSDLGYLLDKYDKWSRYEPEDKAVAIMYASMYGNTENAANVLAAELAEAGVKNIAVYDVSNTHVSELIAEVFRCSHLVLASPTYNNGIYPAMLNFLHDMKALNVQNRTVALMENGSWAPSSAKQVRALLDEMKGMEILEPVVTVKSALKEDSMNSLRELADTLVKSLNA
ncbi:MAG TPA: FprA family A-type flavoprotein [Candidatus Fusicatenibacter intestinigallinarum]|uniref:FprA family A-type flavoprotein n=1 Tax=Candidatus Fusicatenibacter intestinigallinarum TaxID=2838598 RepID=A0A9D2SMA9_9FIRM|nr:FprA family A-type flavoprotein [Candidatus Fusicatenibacter intestinigallinarum]